MTKHLFTPHLMRRFYTDEICFRVTHKTCPTFGPGIPIPSRPGSPGRPARPGRPCKQITHTATTKHDFMVNYENFITEWCHDHAWFLIRALFYSLRARDSHPLLVHLDPEDLGHHDHPEKQSKSNPTMFNQDWRQINNMGLFYSVNNN